VKHFGDTKITSEKIQEACDAAEKSLKEKSVNKKIKNASEMDILRLILVGRNFEEKLLKNEDYQDDVMDDLEFDYNVDLILEKDDNYTVIVFEVG